MKYSDACQEIEAIMSKRSHLELVTIDHYEESLYGLANLPTAA